MKFEQLPVGPDTHCWDDDTGRDCWSYSPELVTRLLAEERERCASLLDAEHEKRKHIDNHAAFYARMLRGLNT